jgi:hypothetical protein
MADKPAVQEVPTQTTPEVQQRPSQFDNLFEQTLKSNSQDSTTRPGDNAAWKPDNNATALGDQLQPTLNQLDTTQEAVLKAQTTPGQGFTETKDATTGAVKRTYDLPALQGLEHTFNRDQTVDLKISPEAKAKMQAGLPPEQQFDQMKFAGDKAYVPDAANPGKWKEATKEQREAAEKTFKAAGGQFTMPDGTTGNWNFSDAKGTTNVAKVPGAPEGTTMSLTTPNSQDDLRYTATVPAQGEIPGYTTEATGTKQDGLRFVDFDDKSKPNGVDRTRTADGKRSIEGLVMDRSPKPGKPPLALTSENFAGDGSETKIGRNRVSETTFPPDDPQGRTRELKAPADHPSGVASETYYDPAKSADGRTIERVQRNGLVHTERNTKNGGYEISERMNGAEVTVGFKTREDATARPPKAPDWKRETKPDGTVTTTYPQGNKDGISSSVYKPGNPPTLTFNEMVDGKEQPVSAEKAAALLAKPPAVSTEDLGNNKTREVRPDGTTVTRDNNAGRTVTESARETTTSWDANKQPTPQELAKMTGLSPDDPRLKDVTGISRSNTGDNSVTLRYDPTKNPEGRSFVKIGRDAAGAEVITRDGIKREAGKPDRHYVETPDTKTGLTTRSYDADPAKGQKPGQGDVEILDKDNKVTFSRTTDGSKVTTFDAARGRTETRDYEAKTWSVDEKGVKSAGTIKQGEKGQLLFVDGKDGKLTGMEFTEGRRAGESYKFTRNENGDLTGMEVDIPARNGQPAQHVNLERSKEGEWKTNPPGQKVPGFDKAVADGNGVIKGEFSTNEKGDIVFQSGDKLTKEILRGNGGRDTYDMRDYSRIRENPDGTVGPKKYWDGYGSKDNPESGWREGTATTVGGKTTVIFKDQVEGRPSKMTRDTTPKADGSPGNGFEVEFANGAKYNVADWKDGKMTLTANGKTETLYNTGATGRDGRVQWVRGQEQDGNVIFDRNDPRVASGEIPKSAKIDPKSGDIESTYIDERRVTTDSTGKMKRLQAAKGAEPMVPLYGVNGEFRGYQQGDRQILKGADVAPGANVPPGTSEWTVKQPGKPDVKFNGQRVDKPSGGFEIVGQNGDKFESNGRFSTKENGVPTVYDSRGQKWQMTKAGDGTTKPTWTVGDKTFTGDMKPYENGNVGIQNGDMVDMANPDKSVSKLDKNGVERERKFADGSSLKRDEMGVLRQFTNTKQETTTLNYQNLPDGTPALVGVETKDASGKVIRVEKPSNGKLREAVLGPDGKEKNPPEFKPGEVGYDRMGTRSEVTGAADTGATRVMTDIHGQVRTAKYDIQGRLTSATNTTGDGNLTFNYPNAHEKTPHEIKDAKGAKIGSRVDADPSDIYDVNGKQHRLDMKTGELKPVNDNAGLDPNVAYHMDRVAAPQERPGTTPDAPALTEEQLKQKYELDPSAIPALKSFASAVGLEGAMTPQNLDKFFDAAKANGLMGQFSKQNLQAMATDIQGLMSNPQAKAMIQSMLSNPAQLMEFMKNPEALAQIQASVPASLKPFLNPVFLTALMKPREQQPPGPDPRRP